MRDVQWRLHGLNRDLELGKIDPAEWSTKFDELLLEGHRSAVELGRARGGGPALSDDEAFLRARGAKDTEAEFLKGFEDAIRAKDGRYFDDNGRLRPGSLDWRTSLYVGRMRGTANEAFVEADPDSSYTWELGGTEEHCEDCPVMAAGSPYSSDTLPSYPGDGSTECLGNCDCVLVRSDDVRGFPRAHLDGDVGDDGAADDDDTVSASDAGDNRSLTASFKAIGEGAEDLLGATADAMDSVFVVDAQEDDLYTFETGPLDPGTYGEHLRHTLIHIDPEQGENQQVATAVHEMAHALDAAWLNGKQGKISPKGTVYASDQAARGDGPLKGWWKAVKKTSLYNQLVTAREAATTSRTREYLDYLLSPKELWARSMTQFVATETDDARLRDEWSIVFGMDSGVASVESQQWGDDDFEKVRTEIGKVLKARGWDVDENEDRS